MNYPQGPVQSNQVKEEYEQDESYPYNHYRIPTFSLSQFFDDHEGSPQGIVAQIKHHEESENSH